MLQSVVSIVLPIIELLPMCQFLVGRMGHCIPKVGILEKLEKEKAMWIHDKLNVLRALPILEILQIPNKCFIFKISILS